MRLRIVIAVPLQQLFEFVHLVRQLDRLPQLRPQFQQRSCRPQADGFALRGEQLAQHVSGLTHTVRHLAERSPYHVSTHLGNGCADMLHRHNNPLWEQLASDELTASLIVDGHHLPPSVVKSMVRAKGDRAIASGVKEPPFGRIKASACDRWRNIIPGHTTVNVSKTVNFLVARELLTLRQVESTAPVFGNSFYQLHDFFTAILGQVMEAVPAAARRRQVSDGVAHGFTDAFLIVSL